MRTAKIGDTVVTMNERDYKQLLKRFDTSKAIADRAYISIEAHCICKFYPYPDFKGDHDCSKCPLGDKDRWMRCVEYIRYIAGVEYIIAELGDYINWHSGRDSEARAQLDTIHDFLLRIPRT